ncbi:NADP-dependent oxidoreductase [Nocardioides sp. TRM66260-LWL]|uniref:quinone oxidoreductase family protein n=1 Tax=Nocardioides sp. TRM66260-LWL TaxID=2874478 RepID=UPI001CC3C967|nr:NADP-dependent oxidoreductase [Nocardioides sp. TRM66260-LWL]MBZ5734085.1 NADP-dependent oxidoreductase [Nocardioides sp. TRM66260-LWL]
MRAIVVERFGGPEVLRIAEIDEPRPGPGQVRIRVRAAGVNPLDWKIRSGHAPFPITLPHVGGLEVAGVVDEVGEGVGSVSIGDEVLGLSVEGFAEHAVLTTFAPKPAGLSWIAAAALPVAGETATRVLGQLGVTPTDTLLVHGAAGSAGAAAAQLAVAAGATVVGTVRRPEQLALLERWGVVPVLADERLVERVREAAPHGVDLALDCAGSGALGDLVELTGSAARVVTIADPSAAEHGVRFSAGGGTPRAEDLARVADLVVAGRFELLLGRTYPYERAGEAQIASRAGATDGKLVLVPDEHEATGPRP